jgi:hypothetical protein
VDKLADIMARALVTDNQASFVTKGIALEF